MAGKGSKPTKERAHWTVEDEASLLEFLNERKSKAGNGLNFKQPDWNAATAHINTNITRGAPKTADSCRSKYGSVSNSLFMPH